MDEVKQRVKSYVLTINPSLEDEGESGGETLLDFVIDSVIDRVLIYTNRSQLVLESDDYSEATHLPIPKELERVIAQSVLGAYRNINNVNTAETGAIKSISDHGQSITYSEQVSNFLTTADDAEIFSGSKVLLDKFVIATIRENKRYIQNSDRHGIL